MDLLPDRSTEEINRSASRYDTKDIAEPGNVRFKTCNESPSLSSVIHDISVFRDFFLAAFSDGYQNAWSCGENIPACCGSSNSTKTEKKVGPDDASVRTSRSTNSQDTNIQMSPSQDTRRSAGRRKKPLAVAVGFKYAEDPRGRPIVVTPTGNRTTPLDSSPDSRITPPRSPPVLPRLSNPTQNLPPVVPHTTEAKRIAPRSSSQNAVPILLD
eukprot:CAMPEP_0172446120 /NCGR_PEP_ID=MMETSP1065-20121228/5789_1 /TAXON_ID=265537 /ORGANISM="Amphiprora paludosa, Strain CCMP125" /LENGTH=212 /DNA_ID=CAMNT_0013197161 /DNA_START=166 /DNA_END=804 /DNA_ORIENTATION=+